MTVHRLRAATTAACLALSLGVLATRAAAEEERIEIGVESMAYDSFFKDCKTRLSVTNKSSLDVHEYRLFMFQLAGGTRVSTKKPATSRNGTVPPAQRISRQKHR